MQDSAIAEGPKDDLGILGQQPSLQLYTQLCFCFTTTDTSSRSVIIDTLKVGLERLSASFPWVAGQVVNEGLGEGNSGYFRLKAFENLPRLVVKELQNDISMDELRNANFPAILLDEVAIAPCKTIPRSSDDLVSSSALVFLLQASFISGGLLLTFNGQHQVLDMIGQAQIIQLFSKACRGEPFTGTELSSGNLDRRSLIPLLDASYKPGAELDRQIVKPISTGLKSDVIHDHRAPECSWAYFAFPPASLTALKSVANKNIASSPGYISTDDALSAFIWQSVTRARLHRLDATAESTFARAVDVRRYFDIPRTYPGLVLNMRYHTYTLRQLAEKPLGSIASKLRLAVDPTTSTLEYDTRALATFLDRTSDKSIVNFVATIDPSTDIMLSSWANLDSYELDFGLGLGKPEAVRRPRFNPVESLIYLMPKTLNGEIAVAICLRDEDMERLITNEEFAKYGEYIG
ncbi:MAG: hypothetical protein Q9201_007847 [Fulgogasparrea decipioides]